MEKKKWNAARRKSSWSTMGSIDNSKEIRPRDEEINILFFLNLALKLQPRGHVRHESLSICMNYLTWIRPHKRGTLQELGWMSNAPIMAVDGTLHLAHRSKFTRRPHSIPIVHLRPTCIYWIDKQRLNVLFITRYTWNIPCFILSSLFKHELISIVGCFVYGYLFEIERWWWIEYGWYSKVSIEDFNFSLRCFVRKRSRRKYETRYISIKCSIYSSKKESVPEKSNKRHGKPSNPITRQTISGRLIRTMKLPNSDSSNLIRLADRTKPYVASIDSIETIKISRCKRASSLHYPRKLHRPLQACQRQTSNFQDVSLTVPLCWMFVGRSSRNFPDKYAIGFQAWNKMAQADIYE